MQRPDANEYHPDYQNYFDLIPAGDYLDMLDHNTIETVEFFETIPAEKHSYRYAERKWTIKEVLMHIIDTERVFTYRALAGARGDASPVYRMDEELYAGNVNVSDRTRGDNFLRKTGAPGAIPTRDLPLRSRIHEPFVFNSYEKA